MKTNSFSYTLTIRMGKKMLLSAALIAACLSAPIQSFALPDTQQGLSIGGLVVDNTGTPVYNIDTYIPGMYTGQIQAGVFFSCGAPFVQQTGSTTNSFFNNVDLSGCPDLIGNGGTYDIHFALLSTTLAGADGGDAVEIIRFSRTALNAPIAIRFEPYGMIHTDIIEVTPSIVDQNGNALFTGHTVNATEDGIGPVGSTAYSVVLDGVPNHVNDANVTRILQLTISSGTSLENVKFPLTFETTAGGSCTELLHIGPAEQAPIPINASFGCASQVPPGNCLDMSSAALDASRAYQKATRTVLNNCGRKDNPDCASLLQNQQEAFTNLQQAQDDVQTYCAK